MMCANRTSCMRFFRSIVILPVAAAAGHLFFFLPLSPVAAQVVINEIYYDHPGTDTGFEFIELVNPASGPLSLAGFSLQFHNGAGEGWSILWSAGPLDSIPADGLFLVGESEVRPVPDVIVRLAMQNGPDAIRLVRDDTPFDIVGYGPLDDPACYETEPAPDVEPGFSLARVPDGSDSGNNRRDFAGLTPSPGSRNIPRRDLSIAVDPLLSRIVTPNVAVPVSCLIRNNGTDTVAARAYKVEMRDSTGAVTRLLGLLEGSLLEPGGAERFEITAALEPGYHHIHGRVYLVGDERQRNDLTVFVMRSGGPPVVISEVMSYPAEGCPQYIELFNCGDNRIDCSGWTMRDAAHAPSPVSEMEIGPRAYAVLTPDRTALLEAFRAADPALVFQFGASWPRLNHSGTGRIADSVVTADRYGFAVESIAYPPQETEMRGRSIERVDLYPGSRLHTWVLSSSPHGGTPGESNTAFRDHPPAGRPLDCSPNPFEIGNEVLLVEVSAALPVKRVVVSVYDMRGVRLRELGSAGSVPALFVWDGRRRGGGYVDPGLYVVACEHYFQNGGRDVERVVIGCGYKRSSDR